MLNLSWGFHSNLIFAPVQRIEIKIINQSDNAVPQYATAGSSGMDIRAFIPSDMELKPLQRALIPTGLFIEIPLGYEVQIRPRSGLAIEHGITCLNSPGTIDADYRGEIKVILINLGNVPVIISSGQRIAQMIVQSVVQAELIVADNLSETGRSGGGFGSTGVG